MIGQFLHLVLIIQFLIAMFLNTSKSLSSTFFFFLSLSSTLRKKKIHSIIIHLALAVLEIPGIQRSWHEDGGAF